MDSKAAIYIGLLSVSLTVLTAFGGSIVLQKGEFHEIGNFSLEKSSYLVNYFIFFSYIFIVILLILAVFFALLAYSTGSGSARSVWAYIRGSKGAKSSCDERDDCYKNLPYNDVAKLSNYPLFSARDTLIETLKDCIAINFTLNDDKSAKIKMAFWLTVIAIFLLLLYTLSIGLIGIKVW